jgi:hypothetical protein
MDQFEEVFLENGALKEMTFHLLKKLEDIKQGENELCIFFQTRFQNLLSSDSGKPSPWKRKYVSISIQMRFKRI